LDLAHEFLQDAGANSASVKATFERAFRMLPTFKRGSWTSAKWSLGGIAGVVAISALAFSLHVSFAITGFLFLLFLVLVSLSGDFAAASLTSFLAVGCLDYFFTPPVFSFEVESPFDLIGLVSFLATGLIIANLVIKVRAKTEASLVQQERIQRLYELSKQLLAVEPDASGFLEPFVGVFGIQDACLFDAVSADVYVTSSAGRRRTYNDLEGKTGQAFIHATDTDSDGISVRCIRVGGRLIGSIGFSGLEDLELTAGPLAALAASHLERRHSFLHASTASAAIQSESYRSAILDALAHEFKTPLSTILAAAGALREAGSLGPHHLEMAETVESEAARLGRLTSRLIRTARLEREEVKPWMELIDLAAVISDTVEQYSKYSGGRQISVVKECESSEVLADPDLLRLAVSQLLDNACKYSKPGGAIILSITQEDKSLAVRVLSPGNPIPSAERSKIFDRFYRGTDARQRVPGSGLGLFVARKIALALGGSLDLDSEFRSAEAVVFRLELPVPQNERHVVASL
jgi:two-component system sensor histidine kinase KdpD